MNNLSKRYVSLRRAILKEKEKLEERLATIRAAVQYEGTAQKIPTRRSAAKRSAPADSQPVKRRIVRARKSSGKATTLQQAVGELLSDQPMTKREIFEALNSQGFRFQSKDPLNSLNAALYRNDKVKRAGPGLFCRA